MTKEGLLLGKDGESLAAELLINNGYKIIEKNYRTKLGEIDIIALEKDTVCFIEVKSRNSLKFGSGFEAVSLSKQRQISKAALCFLKERKLLNKKARFDVVSLLYSLPQEEPKLIKNAFELSINYAL